MKKNILRSKEECTRILLEMLRAGRVAEKAFIESRPDNDAAGFAWVHIPREEYSLRRLPGSPFAERPPRGHLPSMFVSCWNYQSVSAKVAVARAIAESLQVNGVDAHYSSRLD